MLRAFELVRAASYMFGLELGRTHAFISAYTAANGITATELKAGAHAWGVMADHHLWALEEAYLHGNDRARAFIPHRPFVPFQTAWAALVLP